MSAAWVAGSVKARLLLDHRLGTAAALELAHAASLEEAVATLSGTAYGPAAAVGTLEEAQRSVARCTLLQLRVLAAWLPPGGAAGLRTLAAWFELVNIEDRLAYLAGGPLLAPFELGVLTSVWDAAAAVQSPQELRVLLAGSSWGDPGADEPQEISLALRFAWARRVAAEVAEARVWAAGAAAVLLAEELFVAHRLVDPALVRRSGLGTSWYEASTLGELRARLPSRAAWSLAGIDEPAELWRAGLAWWRAVESDAELMVRSYRADRAPVVGAAVLLALDAVRVIAALAVAAHGGVAPAREVLDALC
ncbi:MAG TPA: hypothetical protein VMS63_08510 [Gaiellaceae bacterium]|nr:hypothetical protein [Gaiellaceae bacterium]